MTISFAGHGLLPKEPNLEKVLYETITSLATAEKHLICYCGLNGDFDKLCMRTCIQLKHIFSSIEVFL